MNAKLEAAMEPDFEEISEWIEAFDQVVHQGGISQGTRLLDAITKRAQQAGVALPVQLNTPYVNTIPVEEEVPYPGDRAIERRIKSLIRWNAMAMGHRQNKKDAGIGGCHPNDFFPVGLFSRCLSSVFFPPHTSTHPQIL